MPSNSCHRRVALFVGATALLLQTSPSMAGDQFHSQRPVAITYTKWVNTVPQVPPAPSINLLEAVYRVTGDNGGPSFTALLRGGRTNTPTGGDALLDGFILDGWRTGAPVHVEFTRIPAPSPSGFACAEVPRPGLACFQGTIHVGRAPVE